MVRMTCFGVAAAIALAIGMAPSARAQSHPGDDDDSSFRSVLHEANVHLDEIQAELRRLRASLTLAESQLPAPQADIAWVEILSNDFVVTSVHVWLDGTPLYARDDESGASIGHSVHLLSGPIEPGRHIARIAVKLRGNGALFPYLRAYRFELGSSHAFQVVTGRTATLSIRAFERSNQVTPYIQLPALEWNDPTDAERSAP